MGIEENKNRIENLFDIKVMDITEHNSGYLSILYDFNHHKNDIMISHEDTKRGIKKELFTLPEGEPKKIRIINNTIREIQLSKRIPNKKINRILRAQQYINDENVNNVGYFNKILINCCLPHAKKEIWIITKKNKKVKVPALLHSVKNGRYELKLGTVNEDGLPYGTIPRLIISWLTSEVIRKKDKRIYLGKNLTGFMKNIGMTPRGGKNGNIEMFKNQFIKLCDCMLMLSYSDKNVYAADGIKIVDRCYIEWENNNEDLIDDEKTSFIELSEMFFSMLIENPVPINTAVLDVIKGSSLGLDIYGWVNYRQSFIKEETMVPWSLLEKQFVSNYSKRSEFIRSFKKQIDILNSVYDTGLSVGKLGVTIKKRKPIISKKYELLSHVEY